MSDRPCYSIIAPIYNEEGNIQKLYDRISSVMDSTGETWELVTVNDGSRDGSVALIEALAAKDSRIKLVNFARNFGHQIAVTAGLNHASGEAVVVIDADLQDPPELILEMIERWKAGYQVVYAVREERKGESWFKLFTAKLFYRVINRLTDVNIPLDTGDFRLMDRKVVDALNSMPEHNRFIRGLTSWIGYRQTGVTYVREAREWGETKYPLKKMIRFAMDAVTGFSYFPLQIMVYVSFILGVLAVLGIPIIAILRVVLGFNFLGGQATHIIILLLLSSFQLFFLFIMGQYVARIYDEVRARPLYIVASTSNLGEVKQPVQKPVLPPEPAPEPEV
jgi:polyisoprenyl-phosphate glycosyltransferase